MPKTYEIRTAVCKKPVVLRERNRRHRAWLVWERMTPSVVIKVPNDKITLTVADGDPFSTMAKR